MPSETQRLQKLIVISSALGIMLVGFIVATVSIVPIYDHLKREEERNLKLALNTKTMAVEEYLFRARDVCLQIASRTGARRILEDFREGKITAEEAWDKSGTLLIDAVNASHEVWNLTRKDSNGRVVVQLGVDLPDSLVSEVDTQATEPVFRGPVAIGRASYLIVITPITNSESVRLGTDVVLFRLFNLERIIEDYTGLGKTGETLIATIDHNEVHLFFPFRYRGSVSDKVPLNSQIGTAIQRTAEHGSGIIFPNEVPRGKDVIAYGPVRGTNWALMVRISRDELYAPVNRRILANVKIMIALVLLGTLGMVLLVRPLTGKMIIRADELEREVQEKTADLQKELAGRKRMEKWLLDSERRYRTLLEEVPDVIFILDDVGKFTYVNTQVEKFLETSVNSLLDTYLWDHVMDEDVIRAKQILKVELESIWDEEIRMIAGSGDSKFARIRCKASQLENEPIRYEGVMRDITRRRKLEEELKTSREELLEKIKIIDDLYEHIVQSGKSKAIADHTAEVAHELRQPLAIIGGFARRMARQIDSKDTPTDAMRREFCDIMISEIQRLEKILSNLIDFTRHESVRLETVDPNDIVERVLRVHSGRMAEKELRLDTDLSKEVGEVRLDPNRFEQVVRNLISNAIEASPEKETIKVETRFFIAAKKAQETGGLESESYFELKIENDGKIISPDELQKIFSPFFTTKDYGTGIGLTISKKIVEDHKGSISVKSDREGTVFTVWLPLNPQTAILPIRKEASSPPSH